MKVKHDFLSYFKIYQKMSDILKKYENNAKFIEALKEDHYQKIIKKINMLNEINITKIYNYIQTNSNQSEDIGLNESEDQNEDNQVQGQQVLQEIISNQEYYKEREKELQKIHQTAAQLKDFTDEMAKEVNSQGEILENVEVNVDKAAENVSEAKKNIEEAEKKSKKNSKKICCLIVIIFVAIAAVTAILIAILTK